MVFLVGMIGPLLASGKPGLLLPGIFPEYYIASLFCHLKSVRLAHLTGLCHLRSFAPPAAGVTPVDPSPGMCTFKQQQNETR
jgi:hypothetical protein